MPAEPLSKKLNLGRIVEDEDRKNKNSIHINFKINNTIKIKRSIEKDHKKNITDMIDCDHSPIST